MHFTFSVSKVIVRLVARWALFMEQKSRFGLVLGKLAILIFLSITGGPLTVQFLGTRKNHTNGNQFYVLTSKSPFFIKCSTREEESFCMPWILVKFFIFWSFNFQIEKKNSVQIQMQRKLKKKRLKFFRNLFSNFLEIRPFLGIIV